MAGVAQLVRAPDCGSGGRRFKTGHSPHIFLMAYLCLNALCAATSDSINIAQSEVINSIITDQMLFKMQHEKPNITIIADQFGMREDISREFLGKLSKNVILCVPSHCILTENLIEEAQEFNLCISIDCLNENQWPRMQKLIEKNHTWVKGLVIWSVASGINTKEFLNKIKEWLALRGLWLVYANTNNILPSPDIPSGVFTPDGFVKSMDDAARVTQQADFVVDQAKFKNRGLLLIQPGKHHVSLFIDWLKSNIGNIQLANWSK